MSEDHPPQLKSSRRWTDDFGANLWGAKVWPGLVFALLATLATLGVRLALSGRLDGQATLIIFAVPIMLSAYLGGLWAGLLATLLAFLTSGNYLLPPMSHVSIPSGADRWQLFFVVLAGVVISSLNEALHRTRRRAAIITARQERAEAELQRSAVEQRKLSERLESEKARLVAAQAVAKVGSWETDLATLSVIWSAETFRIFELDPETFHPTHQAFLGLVHPEDRAAVAEAFARTTREPWAASHLEHRLLMPDGRIKFVEERWQVFPDSEGLPQRAVGTCQDITARTEGDAALRESDEKFHQLADNITDSFWIRSPDMRELHYISPGWERTWGRPVDELYAHPAQWAGRIVPEDLERVEAAFSAIKGEAPSMEVEYRLLRPDGDIRWVRLRGFQVRDATGKLIRLTGTASDISESRKAEETLRVSQANMAAGQRLVHVGSWELDLSATPVDANPLRWSDEMFRIAGFEPGAVAVSNDLFFRLVPEEEHAPIHQAVAAAIEQRGQYSIVHRLIRPGGEERIVQETAQVFCDEAGVPRRLIGSTQDITERRASERELARTRRALKMLSDCSEAQIRAENELDLLNKVCALAVAAGYRMAWVGFAQDDEERTITPMAHAGVEEGYLSEIRITWNENETLGRGPAGRAIRTGEAVVCEDLVGEFESVQWLTSAQQRGYRSVIGLPLCHEHRSFGVLCLYRGEVNRPSAEELKLLGEVADNLSFGIESLRARAEQQRLQAAVLEIAEGISGSIGADFFVQLAGHLAEALGAQAALIAQMLPGEPSTARTLAAVVEGKVVPNFDYAIGETPCQVLLHSEISVVAEQLAAHHPESRFLVSLAAQSYVGRRLTDSSGRASGLVCVIFREPLQQLGFIHSTLSIFAARAASELERLENDLHLREQAQLIELARDAIAVCDLEYHVLFWNAAAEKLYGWPAGEVIGKILIPLLYADPSLIRRTHREVLAKGEWSGELLHRTRDGREICVGSRWTLLRDAAGRPERVLVMSTDLTEQKRSEEQASHAQRLESIGTLASGLAHDLNNILAPILMCAPLLRRGLPPDKRERLIAAIEESAQRGAQIVRQVLTFSRGLEGERVAFSLDRVVQEVAHIARETFPKNIRIQQAIASGLSEIVGDAGQWHQVLLNLCVNARDAMPDGGSLSLKAENLLVDGNYASMVEGLRAGPHVVLEVGDTGTGIPPKIAEHIFDPFFTTKAVGQGTGLGLSTVLGIVKGHGGVIICQSRPGAGTTFRVIIPASEGAPQALEAAPAVEIPAGHGETVLIVDDEENVREAARTILELHGYRTIVAADGTEGLARFAEHSAAVSVVLSDIAMPFMDGVALLQALHRMRPGLPMIASTGQGDNARLAELKEIGLGSILRKPYSADLLLRTLASALVAGKETTPA